MSRTNQTSSRYERSPNIMTNIRTEYIPANSNPEQAKAQEKTIEHRMEVLHMQPPSVQKIEE